MQTRTIYVPDVWKNRSTAEVFCSYIPLIGRMIEDVLQNTRFCMAREELYQQLLDRKATSVDINRSKPKEYISIQVATIIMCLHGWPNNCFFSSDSLKLLIFDDDLVEDIFSVIETMFDFPKNSVLSAFGCDNNDPFFLHNPDATFGDLLEKVISLLNEVHPTSVPVVPVQPVTNDPKTETETPKPEKK